MSKREKRFYSKLVKVFESEGREWIAIPKSTLNLSIRDYFDSLTHLSESDHENSIDDFFDTSDFHFVIQTVYYKYIITESTILRLRLCVDITKHLPLSNANGKNTTICQLFPQWCYPKIPYMQTMNRN